MNIQKKNAIGCPSLTEKEVNLLKTWIEEGAEWETHWAYLAPENVKIPELKSGWIQNNVDAFILRQLEGEDLSPNEKADRYTLIRRLSLDLIGLPPSVEEIETFVNDQNPNAYEQLVDRLLTSPHFGERWAAMWLDLARYADSKGYEKDRHREYGCIAIG